MAVQSLLAAVAFPATLLTATSLIDNAWSVAMDRADQAAVLLADALVDAAWYHQRPVTLMGFSLGARMVFKCLEELAARGAVGIVESAVLLGAPVPEDPDTWRAVRSVVAGRLVNVYSSSDWVLGVVYRASVMSSGAAGLRPAGALNPR